MGLPTWEARMQILQMNTAGHAALTEAEWHRAGKETDGFSGSDLKRIANAALKIPIRELKAVSTASLSVCLSVIVFGEGSFFFRQPGLSEMRMEVTHRQPRVYSITSE